MRLVATSSHSSPAAERGLRRACGRSLIRRPASGFRCTTCIPASGSNGHVDDHDQADQHRPKVRRQVQARWQGVPDLPCGRVPHAQGCEGASGSHRRRTRCRAEPDRPARADDGARARGAHVRDGGGGVPAEPRRRGAKTAKSLVDRIAVLLPRSARQTPRRSRRRTCRSGSAAQR